LEMANELGSRMLLLAEQSSFPLGEGLAQRVLGRAALRANLFDAAQPRLTRALDVLSGIEARYEVARTHLDLAKLAHRTGSRDTSERHLDAALRSFAALDAPRWRERIDAITAEFRKNA
ncbi:MAG: hypothetical protein ACRELS_13260, partial [Candidatus Rokuibacteriota bacterium]